MELYKSNTITETEDAIYVIGSYLPFERSNPYDSDTKKSYTGELMLLGYNEDFEIFKSIKVYKLNKSILDDDIFNNKLKNITESNLKDPFFTNILIDNVFSNIEESKKGSISDNTKYINKFSTVIDGKMYAFYDMYSENIEKMIDLAKLLRDELIINIKAQIALKKTLKICENQIKNVFANIALFKKEAALENIKRIMARRKYLSELSRDGNLKSFRDKYITEYDKYISNDDIEIDIDVIEGKFKKVSVLTDFSMRDLKKIYIVYFNNTEDNKIELDVESVVFRYQEKDNLSVPTIYGTYKSKESGMDCKLSIDFKYLMGVNDSGHYVFHDSVVMKSKKDFKSDGKTLLLGKD